MPSSAELVKLWSLAYARSSLLEAKAAIAELQKSSLSDAARRALLSNMVVAYYRPFTESRLPKKKKIVALTTAYVPKEMRSIHDDMAKLRNQTFGHKDASTAGPHGSVNRVIFTFDGRGFDLRTMMPIEAPAKRLKEVNELCDRILQRVTKEIFDFADLHLTKPPTNGAFEVLLEEVNGCWLKQLQ